MKICPECGERYEDELLFCKADGADLIPEEHVAALDDPTPTEAIGKVWRGSAVPIVAVVCLLIVVVTVGTLVSARRSSGDPAQTNSTSVASNEIEQESEGEGEAPPPAPTATPEPVFPGEHFPQTRRYVLPQAEIERLSYSQVRYAINEIYARRGYPFDNGPIRRHFNGMSWYQPKEGRSMEQIEASDMPALEMENARNLAAWKQVLTGRGLSET